MCASVTASMVSVSVPIWLTLIKIEFADGRADVASALNEAADKRAPKVAKAPKAPAKKATAKKPKAITLDAIAAKKVAQEAKAKAAKAKAVKAEAEAIDENEPF